MQQPINMQTKISNSCYSLFDALLKKNGVVIPNSDQVKEISEYLEGYPPSIIYATKQCVFDGVDAVFHDKISLIDYQSRLFSKYLEKIPLDEVDLSLLTAIYNLESIAISPLAIILQKEEAEVTLSLKKCLNFSIIEVNTSGTYTIVDRFENVAHRRATYFMKRGDFESALEYATIACNGERVLPQMHLLRMSIGIHLHDYMIAENEYKYIKENYKHFSVDTCEILYATMLLYKRGWKTAEAALTKIKKKDSSYARNLRCKIIDEQLKDPKVSPIDKEKLEQEREQLRAKKLTDVLLQTRYYDL